MRVRLPVNHTKDGPKGCYGLSMQDGTRYTANRSGSINVDRPDHLRAIAKNAGIDISTNAPMGMSDTLKDEDGSWCVNCKHRGFKWNLKSGCPRCKGPMIPYSDVLDDIPATPRKPGY